MKSVKLLLVTCILIVIAFRSTFSNEENSLLWKIDAPFLDKPSYIYGTIHIRDKRVFNFSDSVLINLYGCDALAMEIHQDSIYNCLFSDPDFRKYVKDKRKTGSEEEDISGSGNQNDFPLKGLFDGKDTNKDMMPTFLDGYLSYLAKRTGKEIISLERFSELKSMIAGFFKERKDDEFVNLFLNKKLENLEDMISLYQNEDIDGIYYGYLDNETIDKKILKSLIIDRNYKMAVRIDSVIRIKSTFVIVGAGHLAGPKGIIELLRGLGYNVTPVGKTYNGVPEPKESKKYMENWYNYEDSTLGYSLKFPSKPFKLEVNNIEMNVYPDLGTGIFYYHFSNILLDASNYSFDNQIEKLKKIYKDKTILKNKDTVVLGNPVRKFTMKAGDYYFRFFIMKRGKTIILNMAMTTTETTVNDDIDRFFNSLHLKDVKKAPDWQTVSIPGYNCSFDFPVKPKYSVISSGDDSTDHSFLYAGVDPNSGNIYQVVCIKSSDLDEHWNYNQKNLFDSIIIKKLNAKITSYENEVFDGFPVKVYHMSTKMSDNTYYFYLPFGNKAITVFSYYNPEYENEADRFIHSFKYNEVKNIKKKEKIISGYKLILPENTVKINSTSFPYGYYDANIDSIFNYNSYEDKTSTYFLFSKFYFSDFTAFSSDSAFKNDYIKSFLDDDKKYSELNESEISGIKVKHLLSYDDSTDIYDEIIYFLNGRELVFFKVSYFGKFKWLFSFKDPVSFITIQKKYPKFDFYSDKYDQIINGFNSEDSNKLNSAVRFLSKSDTQNINIDDIKALLKRSYYDDDSDYEGIKDKLLTVLTKFSPDQYQDFLIENYDNLGKNEKTKLSLLKTISSAKSEKSNEFVYKMLIENPPQYDYDPIWDIFENLEASDNCSKFFPGLLKLSDDTIYQMPFYDFADNLLLNKKISPDLIKPLSGKILNGAKQEWDSMMNSEDENYPMWELITFTNLMGFFPDNKDYEDFLGEILKYDDPHVSASAVISLSNYGYKKNDAIIEKIFSNRYSAYEYLDRCLAMDKKDLIPERYLNQDSLALLDLFYYLTYDDEFPDSLVIHSKRIIETDSGSYVYYNIAFYDSIDEITVPFIGFAGPYDADGEKLSLHGALTGTYYNLFDEKNVDELLDKYLSDSE